MNTRLLGAENLSSLESSWQESDWGKFKQLDLLSDADLNEPRLSQDSRQEFTRETFSVTQTEQFVPVFKVKRRERGDGSGQIRCHCVSRHLKKEIKSYKQYWYHYELWSNGERLVKGSVYIPKSKLAIIQQMESLKLSVLVILEVLGKKV